MKLLFITLILCFGGCKPEEAKVSTDAEEGDEGSSEPVWINGTNLVNLPDSRRIKFSEKLTNLEAENQCEIYSKKYPFGIPMMFTCLAGSIANRGLHGKHEGKSENISCEKFDLTSEKKRSDPFAKMLCQKKLYENENVESINWETDDGPMSLSFKAQVGIEPEGIGSWSGSGNNTNRYPANIQIWGKSILGEELYPLVTMALKDQNRGIIWFDSDSKGNAIKGEIKFSNRIDTAKCTGAEITKENCHWQEIKLTSVGEISDPTLEKMSGANLRVLANHRNEPQELLIEGKIFLRSFDFPGTTLNEIFIYNALKETKEIYFRMIKKGDQLWGSFDFKDGNGKSLKTILPSKPPVDFVRMTRDGENGSEYSYAGNCQDFNKVGFVSCSKINYSKYSELWLGDESVELVTDKYSFPFEVDSAPEGGIVISPKK